MSDPALLSTFRQAVGDAVGRILDIKIKEGFFNGPATDENVGCVYLVGGGEDSNVVRERIEARVRIFLIPDRQPENDVPMSMAPLEALVEKVQVEMSAEPQNIGGVWFARLTEWEFNQALYGVEMAFHAWAWNQWAVVQPTP